MGRGRADEKFNWVAGKRRVLSKVALVLPTRRHLVFVHNRQVARALTEQIIVEFWGLGEWHHYDVSLGKLGLATLVRLHGKSHLGVALANFVNFSTADELDNILHRRLQRVILGKLDRV